MIKRLFFVLLFPSLALLVFPAAADDHQIGFEGVRVGYRFLEDHQAYEDLGITFRYNDPDYPGTGFPTVIESYGAAPPGHVLRNTPANPGDFLSAGEDIRIDLDFWSDHAVVFVGKNEATDWPVEATFRARRIEGAMNMLVDEDSVLLPASPIAPVVAMSVQSADYMFNHLVISFGNETSAEVIDNLTIDIYDGIPPALPEDEQPPNVVITVPDQDEHRSTRTVTGYVEEDRGLSEIEVNVDPSGDSETLSDPEPVAVSGTDISRFHFALMNLDFEEGVNWVTVNALDGGGNRDSQTVRFIYSAPDDPDPPPDYPDSLDIQAVGMEVIQVVQGWEDAGPTPFPAQHLTTHVAGKQTLVRVYGVVDGFDQNLENVYCSLRGFRGAEELPGSPLGAFQPITLVPGETHQDQREDPDKSCNFILPVEWTEPGRVNLVATMRGPDGPGLFDEGNDESQFVTFHDTEQLCLHVYQVRTRSDGDVMPAWSDCTGNIALTQQIYPVAGDRFSVDPRGTITTDLDLVDAAGNRSLFRMGLLVHALRQSLGLYYGMAYVLPCKNSVYLGQVHRSLNIGGLAAGFRPVAISVADPGTDPISEQNRIGTAHEVGHTFGLKHVLGCADPPWPFDEYPQYFDPISGDPYFRASIGDLGWGGHSNTGHATFLREPETHGDIMSYCAPAWMSFFTWNRLFNQLTDDLSGERNSASTSIPPDIVNSPQAAQPSYFIVGGYIDAGGDAHLDPAWTQRLPAGSADHEGEGPLTLTLMDSDSRVLYTRRFTADPLYDNPDFRLFREVIPAKAGTARIVLSGAEISAPVSLIARPSKPEVTITYPTGGERWPASGSREITWMVTDDEDNTLTSTVMYSHDSGRTWRVIGSNLSGKDRLGMSVDLGDIPGCHMQCLVRILVSDNINQAMTTTKLFSKGNLPPLVTITTPQSVDVFNYGQLINFRGLASDREDGALSGDSLTWHSDIDGEFASGTSATMFHPSPGLHYITLTARDSGRLTASDTIGIFVYKEGDQNKYLPVIASGQN